MREALERRKGEIESETKTETFDVSHTWKFTAPTIKATVTDGDAEVSSTPFGPEPDERKRR